MKIPNGGHCEIQYGGSFVKKYAMQIVTIGFLAPQHIYLDNRIELDPQISADVDFEMAAIWNSKKADMKGEF